MKLFALIFLLSFLAYSFLSEQSFVTVQFLNTGQPADTQLFSSIFALFSISFFSLIIFTKKQIRFPVQITFLFGLFITWNIFSLFFSKDMGVSIFQNMRLVGYFILFMSSYNLFYENKKIVNVFLVLLVIVGALVLIKDLAPYIYYGDLLAMKQFSGSFAWHNQMAGFLLLLIPIVVSLLFYVTKPFYKFLVSVMLLVFVVAMVVTYSRGGWLSIVLALLVLGYIAFREFKVKNIMRIGAIGAVAIAILLFINIPNVNNKISSAVSEFSSDTRTTSGSLRTTVWGNSLRMISESPITGVGPGAFGSAYFAYQSDPWLYAKYAHNYFLEIASESGIPALLFFIAILLQIALYVINDKRVLSLKQNPLIVGVIIALIASLTHSFIDVDWTRIALSSLFWVFIAILVANLEFKNKVLKMDGNGKIIYFPLFILLTISAMLFISEKNYLESQEKLFQGEFDSANSSIQMSIKLNPIESRYYFLRGQIFEIQNSTENAKNDYSRSFELSEYKSPPLFRKAIILSKENKNVEAKRLLEQAINLNPYANPIYYVFLSDLYIAEGETEKARNVLTDAIEQRFAINDSYMDIKHRYNATEFKKDLFIMYFKLIDIYLSEDNNEEAHKLFTEIMKRLEPGILEIPAINNYLQKI